MKDRGEWRHIVDVDGQLIGVDAGRVNAETLLRRAGLSVDLRLFLLGEGGAVPVRPGHPVPLSEEEVTYFGTSRAAYAQPAA